MRRIDPHPYSLPGQLPPSTGQKIGITDMQPLVRWYFFLLEPLLLELDLLALLFDFELDALFLVPLDLVGMTHAPSAASNPQSRPAFLNRFATNKDISRCSPLVLQEQIGYEAFLTRRCSAAFD